MLVIGFLHVKQMETVWRFYNNAINQLGVLFGNTLILIIVRTQSIDTPHSINACYQQEATKEKQMPHLPLCTENHN